MYTLNPAALRQRLADCAMTQEALARETGLALPTIAKYCSGAIQSPGADALHRIADVLGCEARDLLIYSPRIALTTAHAASSYGIPVALIEGQAYGPGDLLHHPSEPVAGCGIPVRDLVEAWASDPRRTDADRALAAKFLGS